MTDRNDSNNQGKWPFTRRELLKASAAMGGWAALSAALPVWAKLGKIPSGPLYENGTGLTGLEAAEKWVNEAFQPSTLTKSEQMEEMKWFAEAAKPFQGMDISVVSETIATHSYESKVLAKAFSEITGINLTHDLIQEGDVVKNILTEMQSGRSIYDGYVNDSDFIGTHARYGYVVPLSEWMAGEARDVTLPTLDVDDFIGRSFTTWTDGTMYQLPDQQFANLYWFRYDWFQRPELRKQFKNKYGYDLGVPVNWSAYEDIAEFFTNDVRHLDGQRIYGHMDYGQRGPSLQWRFTDAWLSMAGEGDKGLPNGQPVDEWGIRMTDSHPRGASVTRGGGANSPAAVYSLVKYMEWLKKYAPPAAGGMNFYEAGPVPAQGQVAQQIFWYTTFTSAMLQEGLPVVNDDGTPKWRMAPSPHGAYWEQGMKLGYQDCGSWTFFKHTDSERRKAAWLYAQFCTAKTNSLRKTLVGLTPIRDSDVQSDAMGEVAPLLGGLVEFYRSPARVRWTPTGVNVPDYARLAPLWWQNIAEAVSGNATPQQAMDKLADEMDQVLYRIQRAGVQVRGAPILNEEKSAEYWFKQPGAPKPKLEDEKPPGETVPYDELVKRWQQET